MYQTKFSMLLSLKNILVLTLLVAVSACGFKPLYAKKDGENSHSCSNFTVSKVDGFRISGQKMQYELQDALNQSCINQDKKYTVKVGLTKTRDSILIQKDREVTRYNLNVIGSYQVFEGDSAKAAYSGSSTMVGGFDAVTSDYGTYALEEDTQSKLLEEMANDITLRISSQLLRKK